MEITTPRVQIVRVSCKWVISSLHRYEYIFLTERARHQTSTFSVMKFQLSGFALVAATPSVAAFSPIYYPPVQPVAPIEQIVEVSSYSSFSSASSLISSSSDIAELEEEEIALAVGSNAKDLVKLEKDLKKEVKLAEKIAKEDAKKARIERGKMAFFDYEAKKQAEEEDRVRLVLRCPSDKLSIEYLLFGGLTVSSCTM